MTQSTCDLQHMPLTRAFLCEDCQSVCNCPYSCACCGSNAIMPLAPVLNREQMRKDAREAE